MKKVFYFFFILVLIIPLTSCESSGIVTEQEWKNAFKARNHMNVVMDINEGDELTLHAEIIINDNVAKINVENMTFLTDEHISKILYYEKVSDELNYIYSFEDDQWIKNESKLGMDDFIANLSELFEDFVYDYYGSSTYHVTTGLYTYTIGEFANVEIKFVNKKLAHFKLVAIEDESIFMEYNAKYNYNEIIELPEAILKNKK